MCDYSLHAVASRPAEVGETLVSSQFQSTTTRGFASPNDPLVAVCLRPGTEIAFEDNAQATGLLFRKDIGDQLARFRQIDLDQPARHHDALEFSNGTIILVTNLVPGQRAKVLQLPANSIEQRTVMAQSVAEQRVAERTTSSLA
jgi:hypothetical protein